MNKTVELVNEWSVFEEQFPAGTIDEFCRHRLARRQLRGEPPGSGPGKAGEGPGRAGDGPSKGVAFPMPTESRLMRLVGRIARLHGGYAIAALEGTPLNSIEEFGLLNTIRQLNEPKKTEAISACLYELSTGTDMLARLRKKGLFVEYNDKTDKRSKRLKLTKKGETVLNECHERVKKLAKTMMGDLQEDDQMICIQLLKGVEDKFVGLWQENKWKSL
jgi:DNA-binding MarR family transcriptional regulator